MSDEMARRECSGPPLLRRRDVLAWGSMALAASAFNDFAWAESLSGAERPLPVGYIEGSETIRNLKRLSPRIRRPGLAADAQGSASPLLSAVPAASLFSGDTELIGRPLRIRVDGLYPPAAVDLKARRNLPWAADLEVLFPPSEPAVSLEPHRFHAWGFRRAPGWNPSPPVSFRFPLDWEGLPELVMTVRPAKGEPIVMKTRFTLDDESGRPRLRRGVYLLGFTPGSWDWEVPLKALAAAPAELFSVLITIDSDPEEPLAR